MKKAFLIPITLLASGALFAQSTFRNSGANVLISNGTNLVISGNLINEVGSNLVNDGTIALNGNLTNDQIMASGNNGLLLFNGIALQTLSGGQEFFANNVNMNNISGLLMNNRMRVSGNMAFTAGLVFNTLANKLTFTSTGTHSLVGNTKHVNGFVGKEGTGSFNYPVGDGVRHQTVTVAPTANSAGIVVNYVVGDAGNGPFTAAGTDPLPLSSRHRLEYWNIDPVGTATAQVTVYWDDYNSPGALPPVAERRVAHKFGTDWLNEGFLGSASGTVLAGQVTSLPVSTWGIYTLGSTNFTILPNIWLNIKGTLNTQKQSEIEWLVNEDNIQYFTIEKSVDGRSFYSLGNVNSKGNGTNTYTFVDAAKLDGTAFFRVKYVDLLGRVSYSDIVKLSNINTSDKMVVYPNPFNTGFSINSPSKQAAVLVDMSGKQVMQLQINAGSNYIPANVLASGTYILRTADGKTQKLVKE